MKPLHKAHALLRPLRSLEPRVLAPTELSRVTGGGESASTSTSGTPEAGDDTVGDSSTLIPVKIKHNV